MTVKAKVKAKVKATVNADAKATELNLIYTAVLQLWPKFEDLDYFSHASRDAKHKYFALLKRWQSIAVYSNNTLQLTKIESDNHALNRLLVVLRNMFHDMYWTFNAEGDEVRGAFGNNPDCQTYCSVSAYDYAFSVYVVIENKYPCTFQIRTVEVDITTMSELRDAVFAGWRMITTMVV